MYHQGSGSDRETQPPVLVESQYWLWELSGWTDHGSDSGLAHKVPSGRGGVVHSIFPSQASPEENIYNDGPS